jgi:eukaryotic-like serine/threonine-protein kinase
MGSYISMKLGFQYLAAVCRVTVGAAWLLVPLLTILAQDEPPEPLAFSVLCEDQVDLNSIRGEPIEDLNLWKSNVKDLSPLAGMPIKTLVIFGCPVKDLSPLAGMPLEYAWIGATEARDFSPLKGAPLKDLNLSVSAVTDLSFVKGMPLKSLDVSVTGEGRITDLTPLEGMQLEKLVFEADTVTKGMEILRGMKSLKQINGQPPEEFWLEYGAKTPVRDRLRQAGVSFHSLGVAEDGSLSLGLHGSEIKDLSVLKEFQVGYLDLGESVIRDLSPLKDLKTTTLLLDSSILDDLSSIRGTSLKVLSLGCPKVDDISPLKGLALKELYLRCPKVIDLSALQGMPLARLDIKKCGVRDLAPLKDIPLETLTLDMDRRPRGMEVLRAMKSLKQINYHEVEDFWEAYDAGRFDEIQLPTWMFGWE